MSQFRSHNEKGWWEENAELRLFRPVNNVAMQSRRQYQVECGNITKTDWVSSNGSANSLKCGRYQRKTLQSSRGAEPWTCLPRPFVLDHL
jgi:hypothetical protein